MSHESKPGPNERDTIAMLVCLAGKRGGASDEGRRRAREAARTTWRDTVRRHSRRRRFTLAGTLAAAAVLVLAIGTAYVNVGRKHSAAGPESPTTRVETVLGEVWGQAPGAGDVARLPLVTGHVFAPDTTLSTGDAGQAAIRLASGHSLRLDRGTRVRLLASGHLALERGSIYLSTPLGRTDANRVEVQTPFGSIRESGTQFEVRLTADTLRVRLREGAVVLRGGGQEHQVSAGSQLMLGADGSVTRGVIPPYDAEWDWVLASAPKLDIEGQSALGFLEWIARERGLALTLEDPAVARRAAETVLSGRLGRLSIDHALDAVLPTCGLTYRIDEGRLYVTERRPGRMTPR